MLLTGAQVKNNYGFALILMSIYLVESESFRNFASN